MPAFGQFGENTHRLELEGGHASGGAIRLLALHGLRYTLARGAAEKHSFLSGGLEASLTLGGSQRREGAAHR